MNQFLPDMKALNRLNSALYFIAINFILLLISSFHYSFFYVPFLFAAIVYLLIVVALNSGYTISLAAISKKMLFFLKFSWASSIVFALFKNYYFTGSFIVSSRTSFFATYTEQMSSVNPLAKILLLVISVFLGAVFFVGFYIFPFVSKKTSILFIVFALVNSILTSSRTEFYNLLLLPFMFASIIKVIPHPRSLTLTIGNLIKSLIVFRLNIKIAFSILLGVSILSLTIYYVVHTRALLNPNSYNSIYKILSLQYHSFRFGSLPGLEFINPSFGSSYLDRGAFVVFDCMPFGPLYNLMGAEGFSSSSEYCDFGSGIFVHFIDPITSQKNSQFFNVLYTFQTLMPSNYIRSFIAIISILLLTGIFANLNFKLAVIYMNQLAIFDLFFTLKYHSLFGSIFLFIVTALVVKIITTDNYRPHQYKDIAIAVESLD